MKAKVIQIVIATLVLFFTVQALYWPLIQKPGTVLYWWQFKWAAKVGLRVGAPVVVLVANSPLPGMFQETLARVLAVAWSLLIYYFTGLVISKSRVIRGRHIT